MKFFDDTKLGGIFSAFVIAHPRLISNLAPIKGICEKSSGLKNKLWVFREWETWFNNDLWRNDLEILIHQNSVNKQWD